MGNFALRYKENNRPAPRRQSFAASLVFVIQSVAAILLIGVMLGLGWVMATGDTGSVQHFLNF